MQIFNPGRPAYLQNLLDVNVPATNQWDVRTRGGDVNRVPYDGQFLNKPPNPTYPITVGSIQQWTLDIGGNNQHPTHIHVNHFQVQVTQVQDWEQRGDWLDITNHGQTVKFWANSYGGRVMIHWYVSTAF